MKTLLVFGVLGLAALGSLNAQSGETPNAATDKISSPSDQIVPPANPPANDEPKTKKTPTEAKPPAAAEKPFANSAGIKKTAEERILADVGTAISEIREVKTGVKELRSGQETTHDLLRGIAANGIEYEGSLASAKAKIQAVRDKAISEIKDGVPVVVKKSIGTELENRGYTKPEAPAPAASTTVAKKTAPAISTTASTGTWTNHNSDGSLGSIPKPASGKKSACKHCGQTGPCTGVNYAKRSTVPSTRYTVTQPTVTFPMSEQVVMPATSSCSGTSCNANGAPTTCSGPACQMKQQSNGYWSNGVYYQN